MKNDDLVEFRASTFKKTEKYLPEDFRISNMTFPFIFKVRLKDENTAEYEVLGSDKEYRKKIRDFISWNSEVKLSKYLSYTSGVNRIHRANPFD